MSQSRVLNGLLLIGCLALAAMLLHASLPKKTGRPRQVGTTPDRTDAPVPAASQGLAVNTQTWRPATPDERRWAVGSVRGQLKAFGVDDYARAYSYQGSALQREMPSPASLRAMITKEYPEYAHARTVTFGEARADPTGQHVDVPLSVVGQNGVRSRALYMMVLEGTAYRVGGVADIVRERPR